MSSFNESPEITVFPSSEAISKTVAAQIAELIQDKPDAVLGLPTGTTPLGIYRELAQLHREKSLDFSRVTTFNLDEYYPMESDDIHSYHHFMETNLFQQVRFGSTDIPDGVLGSDTEIQQRCADYEQRIQDVGGIDLQILGIGRNGHIGFNEPGSSRESRTRLVTLDETTRQDAAAGFGGLEFVPRQAITMGIGTIFEARKILVVATGAHKADVIYQALEGPQTQEVPVTVLQRHTNTHFKIDKTAAMRLSLKERTSQPILWSR